MAMAPQANYLSRPSERIVVVEKGNRSSRGSVCRDGIDIQFRPSVLPAFFFRTPDDRIVDLMRVIASVAHADRRVRRRPSICWGRDIELEIPVSDPEFWASEVAPNLIRLLNLLSGDSWSFSFRKPKQIFKLPVQELLAFPPNS